MKRRLLIALTLLVLVPLATLGWLGARLVRGEQAMIRERYDELLSGDLLEVDQDISRFLEGIERDLVRIVEENPDHPGEMLLESGLAPQYFSVSAAAAQSPPPPSERMGPAAREFWEKVVTAYGEVEGEENLAPPATPPKFTKGLGKGTPISQVQAPQQKPMLGEARGWHTWYQDEGLHFLFWWRNASGTIFCVEVDRLRLLADLIAVLPETDTLDPILSSGRVALRDARGQIVYQWGAYEPGEAERARVQLALSPPLGAWHVEYFIDPVAVAGTGRSFYYGAGTGLGALALVLLFLAVYLYRESSRESREAAQRITFVNQVSHELKTPLTNIRMYAELLEAELSGEESHEQKLGVIVGESQRLSRLIGNILTFSRKQRKKLSLHPKPVCVEDSIRTVLESLRPALEAKGFEIHAENGPPETVMADPDAVEQILYNLVSNVEKYAADGKFVGVKHAADGDRTVLEVWDRGPGIPEGERQRVFEPFYRASDKLTDGVAGSGIGLAIARELARLHGGDLRVVPQETGARFSCRLHTPPARKEVS